MKTPDDFADPCVCGGSRAQPNPDCERCQLIAALAAATERLRQVERTTAYVTKGGDLILINQPEHVKEYLANNPDWKQVARIENLIIYQPPAIDATPGTGGAHGEK